MFLPVLLHNLNDTVNP
uniref:Uncharacterized protein n=1 Tax=Anguilla anguilla TaxID=7936 RepID=A0A0E9PH87_ANGAN